MWIDESEPPQASDRSLSHSRASTFYCSAWMFWRGKLQRMSQILRVRSCEPEEKLKGRWRLNRAALAHFECALKV